MCIANSEFKFLDIAQFVAPGHSYSTFLKALDTSVGKGYFPYEYMTSFEKLDEETLPPIEAFYSSIKKENVLESEYKHFEKLQKEHGEETALSIMGLERKPLTAEQNYQFLKQKWAVEKMSCMKDFLAWYNKLDVFYFVEAVEKMLQMYRIKEIDLFKEAISAPGIARKQLFRAAQQENYAFALFGKKHKNVYSLFKKNIVGGPSIIYHRYHEVGKTHIRGNKDKIVANISGLDANALYLYSFNQPMPEGRYTIYRRETGFIPESQDQYEAQYEWLNWIAESENISIQTKRNGSEFRVRLYKVDAFHADTHTVLEFLGCYYHGHRNCPLTKNKNSELMMERWKRTQRRKEFILNRNFNFREIWECQWNKMKRKNEAVKAFMKRKYSTPLNTVHWLDTPAIVDSLLKGKLFGAIQCDLNIPHQWPPSVQKRPDFKERFAPYSPKEYFSEMSPIFCTTDVPLNVIGDHMREHAEAFGLSGKSRRLLIGGMKAKNILLASLLLK